MCALLRFHSGFPTILQLYPQLQKIESDFVIFNAVSEKCLFPFLWNGKVGQSYLSIKLLAHLRTFHVVWFMEITKFYICFLFLMKCLFQIDVVLICFLYRSKLYEWRCIQQDKIIHADWILVSRCHNGLSSMYRTKFLRGKHLKNANLLKTPCQLTSIQWTTCNKI